MSEELRTEWLGLPLRSPVVAGSSGMTDSLDKLKRLEDAGVGAVVLKSLFEEEILAEMAADRASMERPGPVFPEIADMEDFLDTDDGLANYLSLIQGAKAALSVPVVASVNCISPQKWTHFTRMIQDAGADALELNIFLMPSDFEVPGSREYEDRYLEVIREVQNHASIPVTVKLGYHFTLVGQMLQRVSQAGVAGITLFNRFFYPDYDLETLQVVATNVLSTPADMAMSLKWVAIMSGRVSCDIAASTGVHTSAGVIKQILAGATVVQIASVLYNEGLEVVAAIHEGVRRWMGDHHHGALADFRGQMSQARIGNPAAYDRVQFVKNYRSFRR